jgi:hypothetical protein
MTERQHQFHWSGRRSARRHAPLQAVPAQRVDTADEPTILGFPADVDGEDGADQIPTSSDWPDARPGAVAEDIVAPVRLVVLQRTDPVAGVALVLAGVAGLVSLWLPWRQGKADTGLSLVVRGLRLAGTRIADLGPSGLWQPLAIVLGGVVLLLLGLLLFSPARTHRFAGVVALLVASGATAGVLFRLAQADWDPARCDDGMWFAVAVAGLGLLGALKAMLTAPRVTARRRRAAQRVH